MRMLKFWILLFLCFIVPGTFTDKGAQVEWIEHLNLCRSPSSYRKMILVKTAQACKDLCANDRRCLMTKYSKQNRRCFLCDTKSLIPMSTQCLVNFDFYIKVLRVPSVSWKNELQKCKIDKPYKMWFIETAQECQTTCAEESKCKMVKYSREERKCFFSSSTMLTSSNKCMVKYDYYKKVPSVPDVKWIEHIRVCRDINSYGVTLARTAEHCKDACARDEKCSMVKYSSENNKCWKSTSLTMKHSRKCPARYDFYQKDICAIMKKTCKEEELCMNNGRNNSCLAECPKGYYEEDQDCKDVNECGDNPVVCGMDAECFNTLGSYKCMSCGIGYEWNGEECVATMNVHGTPGDFSSTGADEQQIETRKKLSGGEAPEIESSKAPKKQLTKALQVFSIVKAKRSGKVGGKSGPRQQHQTARKYDKIFISDIPELATENTRTETKYTGKSTEYPTMYTEYAEEETKPPERITSTPFTEHWITTKETTIMPASGLPTTMQAITTAEPTKNELQELWIAHPQLCLSVSSYEILAEVNSERQCRWRCEQQKKCVMIQYDPRSRKCSLCDDRRMIPKTGCRKLLDYYIKGRNECKGKRGKCHRNAVCKANRGHRTCQCVYGFEGDGWSCKDVDECSYYKNLCGKSARCINAIGSYSCKCMRGFDRRDGECKKGGSSAQESKLMTGAKTMRDFVAQWKREHSASTSAYVTSVWTLVSVFLLAQGFVL